MYINDQETTIDLLYYESISTTIVKLIKDNSNLPLTIGIHGDWGAGKSSILNMIEKEFTGNSDIVCLKFNGWLFQGFEDAKVVFIETIINELINHRTFGATIREKGKELLRRIDWLKVAKKTGGLAWNVYTGLPSPDQVKDVFSSLNNLTSLVSKPDECIDLEDIKNAAQNAKSFLKPPEEKNIPEEMHKFREEFSQLLDDAKIKQIIVLIDDLDRCLPKTAVETLEAIRLFLFIPKTAFVIAADEGMIEYSVKKHFPDLPTSKNYNDYARNYLEKLIQIPFRIPALGSSETCTYITLLFLQQELSNEDFDNILNKAKELLQKPWTNQGLNYKNVSEILKEKTNNPREKIENLKEILLLCEQISPILGQGTKGNPRQIKRFINSLLLRQEVAKHRGFLELIRKPVLAKLMLLELFEPDLYKFISEQVTSSSDGVCKDLNLLEKLIKENSKEYPNSIQKWKDNTSLKRWVNIEPDLGEVDLQPYIFVAKDKKQYLSLSSMDSELEELIDILLGDKLAISRNELKIKRTSLTLAEQAFEIVAQKIKNNDSFEKRPKGILGLQELAKVHAGLQSNLINLLEILPGDKLGTWVLNGWDGCFLPENSAKFIDLGIKWKSENKKLSQIASIKDKMK